MSDNEKAKAMLRYLTVATRIDFYSHKRKVAEIDPRGLSEDGVYAILSNALENGVDWEFIVESK